MPLVKLFLVLSLSFSVAGHAARKLTVTSDTIKAGKSMQMAQVFNGFGCSGQNISPHLKWTGAPAETKAFMVTMYDPDAPTGSGWWHWTVANIPPTVTSLAEGASSEALPVGAVEGRTDFGRAGYGGPCPPPGKPHRYIFKVYALKDTAPVDKEGSGALYGFQAGALKLAEGSLEVKYGRSK